MANKKKEITDAFVAVVKRAVGVPGAVKKERVKNWTGNPRVVANLGDGRAAVIKLGKALVFTAPRVAFKPALVFGDKKGILLLGAILSRHGGQVAVEIAKRAASDGGLRLVVLDRTILVFEPWILGEVQDATGRMKHSIEKLQVTAAAFKDKLNALLNTP